MLKEAIDLYIQSELSACTKIEALNEITDQLLDTEYISNIRVKLIELTNEIASEQDICPNDGMGYEYRKGIKRCPSCGRRSDNE